MTREARRFYLRYYLLTRLCPAYAMALLFYGAAWLLACRLALGTTGSAFFGAGIFVFLGLSRLLAWLGFLLSGVPRARVAPTTDHAARLERNTAGEQLPVVVRVVELGPVPYIASGGLLGNELWVSTHTLTTLPEDALRCMVLHEAGHGVGFRLGCAWEDLLWVLAFPVAFLLRPVPLLILAAALVHAQLWLHLVQWLRDRAESAADRWAAARSGRPAYARALAQYLGLFGEGGARLCRSRLRRLGLSAEEIERLDV